MSMKITLPAAARPTDSAFDATTYFAIEFLEKSTDGNPALCVESNDRSPSARRALAHILMAAFDAAGEGASMSPPQEDGATVKGMISYPGSQWFEVGLAVQFALADAGVASRAQYQLRRMSYHPRLGAPGRSGFWALLPFGVSLWDVHGQVLDMVDAGMIRIGEPVGEFEGLDGLRALLGREAIAA